MQERDAITFAICELKRELNKTLPGNMVAWSSDTGDYFDYKTLTEGSVVLLQPNIYVAFHKRSSSLFAICMFIAPTILYLY